MKKQSNYTKHVNGDGRVLGVFHKDSAIGYAAQLLEDEKPHNLIDVVVDITKKTQTLTPYFMLRRLRKDAAKREVAKVYLDTAKKIVRMKILPKGKPAPPEPIKLELMLPPDIRNRQLYIQKLIRNTMSAPGARWTRPQLVKHLADSYKDWDKKFARKAIDVEIQRGGLKLEDGVLHLL